MAKTIPGGKPYAPTNKAPKAQKAQENAGKNTVDKLKARKLPGKRG